MCEPDLAALEGEPAETGKRHQRDSKVHQRPVHPISSTQAELKRLAVLDRKIKALHDATDAAPLPRDQLDALLRACKEEQGLA